MVLFWLGSNPELGSTHFRPYQHAAGKIASRRQLSAPEPLPSPPQSIAPPHPMPSMPTLPVALAMLAPPHLHPPGPRHQLLLLLIESGGGVVALGGVALTCRA
jgi:hypothetical protein